MTLVIAGASLIVAVFVLISIPMIKTVGWRITLGIWAFSVALTAVVAAGAFLIAEGVS
jgi:hypothetical protein